MPGWFQWLLSIAALACFISVIVDTAQLRVQRRRDRKEFGALIRDLGRRVASLERGELAKAERAQERQT